MTRPDAEANTQAELYHQCKLIGLECTLELHTPFGRLDAAILQDCPYVGPRLRLSPIYDENLNAPGNWIIEVVDGLQGRRARIKASATSDMTGSQAKAG